MRDDELSIREEKMGDISRFFVKGRVNSISANVLQHKLSEAWSLGRKDIIVNMMEVTFLSSAGIKVLLMFYKRAKTEGGSFFVDSPSENVVNVLGMAALDDMLLPGLSVDP